MLYPQAPKAVIMIRPHFFYPNEETKLDNEFQSDPLADPQSVQSLAYQEVTEVARLLQNEGVEVQLFEDESIDTPDSVFPNNWISTHAGGQIALYPMYAKSRRKERRSDIVEWLKAYYRVQDVIDYSGLEYDNLFLEGTGSMVLDHVERVAYCVLSKRSDSHVLERFCSHFNFEPVVFEAQTRSGAPIYHTNVMMCVGSDYVLAGFDMIPDEYRRKEIMQRFQRSDKTLILLSESQINTFCGNALELQGAEGRILVMSSTAVNALTNEQLDLLNQKVKVVSCHIPTIELAGGSLRCMLAGIHLSKR